MQGYVTPLSLGVLLFPHLLVVVALLYKRTTRVSEKGWSMVTPGMSYWLPCVGSFAFSLLIIWVWAFVGSARSDAEFQMQIAWWLALFFAWSGAWCAWRIAVIGRQALRWRGSKVRWYRGSNTVEKSLENILGMTTAFASSTRVTLSDGTVMRVDNSAFNSSDLLARVEELNGLADPDAPGEH